MLKKGILILCLFSHAVAYSWWDKGHMVVAKIAEDRLLPEVRVQVEELIDVIGESAPDSATFIEASVWLDDIGDRGMKLGKTWHGSDRPYDPEGILPDDFVSPLPVGNDAVAVIESCIKRLASSSTGKWEKAFLLRVLIHCVGDIHCPMHCIIYYSPEFPQGDRAGTRYPLSGPPELGKKNLHALWDSLLLIDTERAPRPLSPYDRASINDLADEIAALYPEYLFPPRNVLFPDKDNRCPEDWAHESYCAGIQAYQGIEPNTTPSDNYIEASRAIAFQRLAIAGYRLADILNDSFSS